MQANPKGQAAVAAKNQSDLYELFGENEKLTISELAEKARMREIVMSERTIRRSLKALEQRGWVKTYGFQNNANIYGRVIQNTFSGTGATDKILNVGGNLETVESFLRTFADPESSPFELRTSILTDDVEHKLRRILLFVALTAGDAGMSESLKKQNANLNLIINELRHILNLLTNFVDSPVWYQHYRDTVAYALRETRKEHPELVQLAVEYAKGG